MMMNTAMISGSSNDGVVSPKVINKIPKLLIPSGRLPDHAQLFIQNHPNFTKSGNPVMFMLYKDGSWRNFEKHVMDVLLSAFVSSKGIIKVEMEGFKFIIDFYRMLGIDLDTGNELPIAWIDVNGKYFFPKVFIDEKFSAGEELGKRKRGNEDNEVGSSSRRVVATTPTELVPPKWPRTRSMRDIKEELYQKIKAELLALTGGCFAITAVHQCMRIGPVEQAREEVFKDNVEIVTRARGNPRSVYAWYGTSSKNVERIMRRGFEMPRIVPGSHPYGVGIYLSPLRLPQISEMMSAIDENGEKHMILCRVILGNSEKVELGSQQFFRSSADYDSGVDDLMNPKLYVVWCGNMNTHILPQCIVSFKPNRHMPGRQNGGAHSSFPWSRILSKLHNVLPLPKQLELKSFCNSYGEGTVVPKEIYLRQIQAIVQDDQLIRSIMLEIFS